MQNGLTRQGSLFRHTLANRLALFLPLLPGAALFYEVNFHGGLGKDVFVPVRRATPPTPAPRELNIAHGSSEMSLRRSSGQARSLGYPPARAPATHRCRWCWRRWC